MRPIYDIMADPDVENKEELAELQKWVDDGRIWHMEGYIGRTAAALLDEGYLKYPEDRTYDYWGNPVPTRKEWEEYQAREEAKEKAEKLKVLQKAEIAVPLAQREEPAAPALQQLLPQQEEEEEPKEKEKKKRLHS